MTNTINPFVDPNAPAFGSVKLTYLTPEFAKELLGRNPRNRNISRSNLLMLKRAIANGEWELNGEAIKISKNGYILDGQHRCLAVVETNTPIWTLVMDGLDDSVQDTMDQGKSRSLGDVLAIRGEANTVALASIIRRVLTAEKYGLPMAFTGGGGVPAITVREALHWYERNAWVKSYVHPAKTISRGIPLGAAAVAALMRAFDEIDSDDASHFWSRLLDGVNLEPNSPILVLSRILRTLSDTSKGVTNQRYVAAITIKAWNSYRNGASIGLLKFRPGGATPERFPEPK